MAHTYMPVMKNSITVAAVPWTIFNADDEAWAQKNHGQTLGVLAGRGGLGICELVAILDHRPWCAMKLFEGWQRLFEIFAERQPSTSTAT